MTVFEPYLEKIEDKAQRNRLEEILRWISKEYPELAPKIAWNQPMFTHHDAFIIGFSIAKKHLAIAPEKVVIDRFSEKIKDTGYNHTQQLFRIEWDQPINYQLIKEIIDYNIIEKAECTTFWRK